VPVSAAQARTLEFWEHTDARHLFLPGPVRSGKTWAAVRGLLDWAALHRQNSNLVFVAKTAKQIRLTLMTEAHAWAAERGARLTREHDSWLAPTTLPGGAPNRIVPLPMAEGRTSVERLRGMTLAGGLVDEATAMHPALATMLETRLSDGAARCLWTCNPEGPLHWFRTDWILNPRIVSAHWPYRITDNPTLTAEYLTALEAALTGPERARLFEGRWAAASGLVWPTLGSHVARLPPGAGAPWASVVGVDYAASSVTHALLLGLYRGQTWHVTAEWRHDHTHTETGRGGGRLTSVDQARGLVGWAARLGHPPNGVWAVDPAAADLAAALTGQHQTRVIPAHNDRLNGVRAVEHMLSAGRLKIDPACRGLLAEADNYTWAETPAESGRDDPIKANDHACDALRYAVATVGVLHKQGRLGLGAPADVVAKVLADLTDKTTPPAPPPRFAGARITRTTAAA